MIPGIWQEFIKLVKQELGSQMVETWLKAVSLLQWDARERVVLLQTPNTFVKDWLGSKFHNTILKALRTISGNIQSLHYTIHKEDSNQKQEVQKIPQNSRWWKFFPTKGF